MTIRPIAAAIIVGLSLVSCAVYSKQQPIESDKALVTAYVDAWNRHDTTAIDTLLARNAIHEDAAENFRGKGSKAVIAFMKGVIAAEPDFKWTVINSMEDGRFVGLEWTWTGTYTGPDPTGKPVKNRRVSGKGSSIAEVDNGKITRFSDYYDNASFFR
jgi:steroid delta-isomerase-like uncharacterized protein